MAQSVSYGDKAYPRCHGFSNPPSPVDTLFLFLAFLVGLSSSGPIFYRWKVIGSGGRPFTGYKFRSMVVNADALRDELASRNEMTGPVFKIANDPRITKVGDWLRKYSLDELPQLYSVLKGDMSLVGPRPPLVTEYEQFTEYQKQKMGVKPGITCLWQVSGRNQISDFDEWVRLDLEYISRWSLSSRFRDSYAHRGNSIFGLGQVESLPRNVLTLRS